MNNQAPPTWATRMRARIVAANSPADVRFQCLKAWDHIVQSSDSTTKHILRKLIVPCLAGPPNNPHTLFPNGSPFIRVLLDTPVPGMETITLLATSSSGIPLRSPTPTSQSPDYWQEAESAHSRVGPGRGGDERGGGDEHVHTGGGLRAVGLSGIVNWSETTNPKDGDGDLIAPVHRSSDEVCHHRGMGKEYAAGTPLRHRRPPMRRTDERNSDSGLPHCHASLSPPLPEDIGLVEPPINRLRWELSRLPWGFTKINHINEGEVQTSCMAAKDADPPVENSVYSLLREAFESLGVRCYDLALHSQGFDSFVKHYTVYTQTFLHPQREIFADEIYIGWRLRATFHRCTGRMGKRAGGWIYSLVAYISWWW